MKLAVAGVALMLFAGCATRPTIVEQAAALHNSRMQEYAAIRDPDERARMENLENYRYQQFLAGMRATLEQSARMRMYQAQTEAAQAQAQAARAQPIVYPSTAPTVPYVPMPQLPPQFGTYPGSRLNPIHVEVVPT